MTDGKLEALHPIPHSTQKWGYDHLPYLYRKQDLQWEAITGTKSFEAGLCRLVSGWDGSNFSRGPDSWISLDTYSIGIAHWWAKTAPELLSSICDQQPILAEFAWGKTTSMAMTNPDWLLEVVPPVRGKTPHHKNLDWLLSGWFAIARHPNVIKICVDTWLAGYTKTPLKLMEEYGWNNGTSLAGLVRMTNSRGSSGVKKLVKRAINLVGNSTDEMAVIKLAFEHPDLYDKPKRLKLIQSWPEFVAAAPQEVDHLTLFYDAEPQRVDGTVPVFPKET
ncbi:hypothetical protein [uncultured Roseovarius sp.]|uniref:hypothetical protein n=1 Tax=uncultured Roseovarius sp. TaxID=293344 RepID=UPI00261C1102|nr:hypothetical protein [uncultured Roseovarius sp.]